jgi:hypothetical protein
LDVVFTGVRTSTLISFVNVPLFLYVVRRTRSCWVFPPPDGNDSVFQPESESEPVFVTHRYDTSAGTFPTVMLAVNVGAFAVGGGQLPEYSVLAPSTVTRTDCGAEDDLLALGLGVSLAAVVSLLALGEVVSEGWLLGVLVPVPAVLSPSLFRFISAYVSPPIATASATRPAMITTAARRLPCGSSAAAAVGVE